MISRATRKYKTTDKIAKLLLPVLIIALYLHRALFGLVAKVLIILALLVLIILSIKALLFFVTRD